MSNEIHAAVFSHFFPPDHGGIPRLHEYAVPQFRRLGIDPLIITRNEIDARIGEKLNCEILNVSEYGTVFEEAKKARFSLHDAHSATTDTRVAASPSDRSQRAADAVLKSIGSRRVDLVNSHIFTDLEIAEVVAAELRVPHVHTAHSAYRTDAYLEAEAESLGSRSAIDAQKRANRFLRESHATLFVVHTEYLLARYVEIGIPRGKLRHVVPGIDLQYFYPRDNGSKTVHATLDLPDRPIVMCPSLRKGGFENLLRAFSSLESTGRKPVLLVCNTSTLPVEYLEIAQGLGVQNDVYCREVPEHIMPDTYSASSVVVMCSTEEGIGLPALEARACGTPVIANGFGPFLELIEDGYDGLLVDANSAEQLASSLESILYNEDLRRSITTRGLESVRLYDSSRLAGQYSAIMREAVGMRGELV